MRHEYARARHASYLRAFLLAAFLLSAAVRTVAAPSVAGAVTAANALAPSAAIAELGALPDPLPLPRLVEAALLCSGVPRERVAFYADRVDVLLREAAAAVGAAAERGSAAELGSALLDFLHARVFRAYSEQATTLDGVLDSGRYNCVSSALLYMIAARSLGLEVSGSRTVDHALCVLRSGSRDIDVETTNPYGFDPGTRKEFKDSFGRTTGYAYAAPGAYSGRRRVGDRGMVGLVLSNRASLLERSGRYREALALGADYYALCRDADSRSFLVDRVNNVVADLSERGDISGAESLAAEAAGALPGESAIAELAGKTLEALAAKLAASGDYEGARRAALGRRGLASEAAVARALAAAGDAELVRAANTLPFARAIAVADRLRAAGQADEARYAQAIAAIYGREAARLGAAGDWLAAAALAEEGAAKAPGDGSLARAATTMRRNFTIASHNAFAALYNAGDYAGARRAIESALAAAPGDATLARDLEAAKSAEARRLQEN